MSARWLKSDGHGLGATTAETGVGARCMREAVDSKDGVGRLRLECADMAPEASAVERLIFGDAAKAEAVSLGARLSERGVKLKKSIMDP